MASELVERLRASAKDIVNAHVQACFADVDVVAFTPRHPGPAVDAIIQPFADRITALEEIVRKLGENAAQAAKDYAGSITALEAEVAQAYARGLEDAAKVAERSQPSSFSNFSGGGFFATDIASAIRALDPQAGKG